MSDERNDTEALSVGFVGASGLMGNGMAKNIAAAGFPLSLVVHNTPVPELIDAGATELDDYAALGSSCDVVVVCVTASPDVEQVVAGPNGLLTDPKQGLVIVDASTSEPAMTARLASMAADKGVGFVDAPMTRGPAEAQAGTLNVLVGGDDESVNRVRPVLSSYAEQIIPTGAIGSAHTIKLLNNFVIQAAATALAEAFTVATKSGADPKTLVKVMSAGMFNNKLLDIMAATLDGDYDGMEFMLGNARKDVRYYTRLAGDQAVAATVGDGVHEALTLAAGAGFNDDYVPSMVRGLAKAAGLPDPTEGQSDPDEG